MNLTTDPWVPVIAADGSRLELSLQNLFQSSGEVRDLSVKPHEKVALLRLLLCITQAALDGPEDHEEWDACQDAIPERVREYLEKWRAGFELFGDGPRFLQVSGLKPGKEDGEGNPVTKLDLMLASGNNSTLFDNAAGEMRQISEARLALTLLAFQGFAPGGRIGVAKWNGAETAGKGSSNHAPCTPSGMLHTYVHGGSLLETLHLNLLTKQAVADSIMGDWGRPIWEDPVDRATDKRAVKNATTSYLGRLVPLSRAVRLDPGGREMVLANGLDYPLYPSFREPAATVVSRKDGPGLLGVSLGRSVWRQLSAITVKRITSKDILSGPLALGNLTEDRGGTLWIAALSTDKAKIEDVVEAAYDVPAGMFRDNGRKLYEEGIALADSWQNTVSKCIKAYADRLEINSPPYECGRQYFWTAVEQHVRKLLRLAGAPESVGDLKTTDWGAALQDAAHAAYEFSCPRQTPRQIEAFAVGRQNLRLPKLEDESGPERKQTKSKTTA